MKQCDIIIPTYNNERTLPLVMRALDSQYVPQHWRVHIVICDDGSDIPYIPPPSKYAVECLRAKHQGAAAARNRGIEKAKGDIVFFLGADIVLSPGALSVHLQFHDEHPGQEDAALGMVVWDPHVYPSPFMEWLTHGGPQNDFDALLGAAVADPKKYFYGSHVSLKRALLGSERFDDSFGGYGYEDIELGWRLARKGMKLSALHKAIGLHHHTYTPATFAQRQQAVGQSVQVFTRKVGVKNPHTHLHWRHVIQNKIYTTLGIGWVMRAVLGKTSKHISTPRLYAHMANYEYRAGMLAKQ